MPAEVGSNPIATTLSEIWRNIITDLGYTGTYDPSTMDSLLHAFDAALFGSQGVGATGIFPPTGAKGVTFERPLVGVATTAISTGVGQIAAVWLPINTVISNFNFMPGATGDAGPTHQWMALYNSSKVLLATSADATSGVITANTPKAYAVATTAAGAATSFVTTYSGLHLVQLMIATANSPTLATATGVQAINGIAPIITGTVGTGQTTAPTFPTTLGTITATATTPYFWLT